MPTERQIRLAAEAMPALAPLCRTMLEEKLNERAMERRKDAELELIEAKQQVDSGPGASLQISSQQSETRDTEQQVIQQDQSVFDDSIDQLQREEDCGLCARLLDGIRDVDPEDRARALSEYGRFKQSVDDTDDVSQIRDEVDEMPVLKEVMETEFNMV